MVSALVPTFLQVRPCFRVRVEHTLPLTLHGSGAKRDRDRAGRSKRPVAMGPVAQLLLPSASLGFLLQWTPGALCVAIPSSLERRLSLTPYPFQCLWGVMRHSGKPVNFCCMHLFSSVRDRAQGFMYAGQVLHCSATPLSPCQTIFMC